MGIQRGLIVRAVCVHPGSPIGSRIPAVESISRTCGRTAEHLLVRAGIQAVVRGTVRKADVICHGSSAAAAVVIIVLIRLRHDGLQAMEASQFLLAHRIYRFVIQAIPDIHGHLGTLVCRGYGRPFVHVSAF